MYIIFTPIRTARAMCYSGHFVGPEWIANFLGSFRLYCKTTRDQSALRFLRCKPPNHPYSTFPHNWRKTYGRYRVYSWWLLLALSVSSVSNISVAMSLIPVMRGPHIRAFRLRSSCLRESWPALHWCRQATASTLCRAIWWRQPRRPARYLTSSSNVWCLRSYSSSVSKSSGRTKG